MVKKKTTRKKTVKKKPVAKKKKLIKKKVAAKKRVIRKVHSSSPAPKTELGIERSLVQNFIALQKVMVNLSVKFDSLTTQISKLLDLFEISAKALAEKDYTKEKEVREDKQILAKMDNLSDQNKVLARGLTLLHEPPIQQRRPMVQPMQRQIPAPRPPMPQIPRQQPALQSQNPQMAQGQTKEPEKNMADYQKSISSNEPSSPQKFKQL